MKIKHYAAMAAAMMLMNWGCVSVQAVDSVLDEVIVEEDRVKLAVLPGGYVSTRGNVGLLGNQSMMDVPFSQVNMTEKTIETFGGPNQPLQSILANAPAVRVEGTTLHNDVSIRGLKSTGTSFYLNGIPGLMTQFSAPTFFVSGVQVISGPNSGITGIPSTYETSTAGGIVNFVSKKADAEPVNRNRYTFSGTRSFGKYMDWGRRYGKNNEWGVRVNTEWLTGETAIDNHKMDAQGIFVNVDHADENSKTNFLTGYRHLKIRGGQRWFALGNHVTEVPDAPDAGKDYGFDGQRKEAEGVVLAFNHEQRMNSDWKWFANMGLNHNKLRYNTGSLGSSVDIINNNGDVKDNVYSTQTVTKNYYFQFGMNGQAQTGEVDHDITLAVEKAWHSIEGAKSNYSGKMGTITGNIYSGIIVNGFWQPSIQTGLSSKDQYWAVSLVDTVKYKKSQLLLGIHKHNASVDSYKTATGVRTNSVESHAVSPTYGYVYRPNEKFSFYASHSENFDKGTVVASGYENEGEILDPAKTKQNEVGVKYQDHGLLVNLGYFDIKQANNFAAVKDGLKYFLQDGEQEYKGIELSVNGRVADKWNIMGGVLYVDASQNKTAGGANNGKTANGAAKWSGVASLEYEANDEFSAVARMLYNGKAKIDNDKMTVPSYVTFDMGFNYKTRFGKTPVTFSAMCYNVTDKNYWNAHGNGLLLSNPRTFMLSATVDF